VKYARFYQEMNNIGLKNYISVHYYHLQILRHKCLTAYYLAVRLLANYNIECRFWYIGA
jgi:hypothetical protein